MKKIFLLTLIVFILPLVISQDNALQSIGPFKQGTQFQIVQSCTNGTVACDSCFITELEYPNGTTFKENKLMSKSGTFFSFNIFANESGAVGEYKVNGTCSTGEELVVFAYKFPITFSGGELSTAGGLVSIVFLIGILFVFGLCLYGAIRIPWGHNTDPNKNIISVNDLRFVKIFLIGISYVMLFFIFGILKRLTENFLVLEGATSIFNWLFILMRSFMWPLIVLTLLISFIVWLQNLSLKKKIERGAEIQG